MADTFDAFRYISYLRSRWRFIATCCAVALMFAITASVLARKQYTATARVVIEPPAGTDLRSAMAVSPIYLESLKTYELFAASDSLFNSAIDRLQLRQILGAGAIESLKRRVLKVEIVRNTRILEISATLPDPQKAQRLASFLGDSTVAMNRSLVAEGDQDLLKGIEQQERDTRERLQGIDVSWAHLLSTEPTNDLEAGLANTAKLRTEIQQQSLSAELEIADAAERLKPATPAEQAEIRKEQTNARARLEEIKRQLALIDRQTAEKEKLLYERIAHRDKLDADRKAALQALAAIEARLREARGDIGYRGERLKVIDPGIVPERPSSPNIPLNVMAALLAAVVLSTLYLTLSMSLQEHRDDGSRDVLHALAKARDD
jgi:uncharacterized protein involved in exopolysaccharide biosynthesis